MTGPRLHVIYDTHGSIVVPTQWSKVKVAVLDIPIDITDEEISKLLQDLAEKLIAQFHV